MTLNLLDVFSYYLLLSFLLGTVLRARNYRAILGLVYGSSDRLPKLRALVKSHRAIFLRWPTVLPLLLTLLLMLANALASNLVWSHARVTPTDLWAHPVALAIVAVAGGLMGILDYKAVFVFGR